VKRALALGAFLALASAVPALACPTCYGNAEGPMIDAARLGMLDDEWSRLQRTHDRAWRNV
jgi:hypothetical protein